MSEPSSEDRTGWRITPFGAVFLVLLALCVALVVFTSGAVETVALIVGLVLLSAIAANGLAGSGSAAVIGSRGTFGMDPESDEYRLSKLREDYTPASRD